MLRKRVHGQTTRSKSAPRKKQRVIPKLGKPTAIARAQHLKQKLTYCEAIQLDPGIAAGAAYVFAANGLFDPNITGTGHQCAGFDQLMQLYNEYVVTASWIKIVATNTDANSQQIVGISFLDKNATSSDVRQYIEQGNSKWNVIDVYKSGSPLTLTHEANIRNVSTQDIFNEDNFAGSASSNPVDTHFWHLFAAPVDLATNTAPVQVIVEIQYEVYFRDPQFVALS